jgi:hypothetical protein
LAAKFDDLSYIEDQIRGKPLLPKVFVDPGRQR